MLKGHFTVQINSSTKFEAFMLQLQKFFLITRTVFSHRGSEQFWKQHTISLENYSFANAAVLGLDCSWLPPWLSSICMCINCLAFVCWASYLHTVQCTCQPQSMESTIHLLVQNFTYKGKREGRGSGSIFCNICSFWFAC